MKKFLIKISLFLLPFITLFTLLEYGLRKIPNDYSYKNQYLKNHSSKIEVLFLGSSHAYFGINPEFIKSKNSFNGAHVGQALRYDLEILKKYNFSDLEYLVIPIDYLSLYPEGESKSYIKNYKIYYGFETKGGGFSNNFEALNGLFNKKIEQVWDYLYYDKNNLTSNSLGWGTIYKSENQQDLVKTGKLRAEQQTKKNDQYLIKNINRVNEIIKISKSNNFKILFYTSPAYITYKEYLDTNQLKITIDTITNICKENNNLYYYNLLNDSQFIKEDFWDGNHLNELGAKKLTIKLDSILSNLSQNK